MKIWRAVAQMNGWSPIIATGDQGRGGKLVTFVMHMVKETDFVWKTIDGYVWGVRTWMQSQHQDDPIMNLHQWDTFMKSIKVMTWAPGEPRQRCPVEVVEKILDAIDLHSFWEVQLAFIILVLLFTFSRTECPCPKVFEGRDSYDAEEHFNVCDFDVAHVGGRRALRVRFRKIKQDPRVERAEARGDGDWSVLGEIQGSKFCPLVWYTRLMQFMGPRSDKRGPMFLDPDRRRPLIYSKLRAQFRDLQDRVGVPDGEKAGPHGLRVEGYNGVKAVLGGDLAQAHGLWKSDVHERYSRFRMQQVVRIPAAIVGVDRGDMAGAPAEGDGERSAGPPSRRMRRSDLRDTPLQPSPADAREFMSPRARGGGGSDADDDSDDEEEEVESGPAGSEDGSAPAAGSSTLHALTPGGTAGRPAGFWGQTPLRRPPAARPKPPAERRR
jgi:hypothetical protein